ncbi:hypothetical protein [Pseudomonas sp. SCB32]|uniref:hypothetical protein n=1 Tax=Pseudomonas sp. SCB32 TaxID=2653853 RepID=UPI0012649EE7|nr:hypothetical protein [Pseudomonas sp. SCB32]
MPAIARMARSYTNPNHTTHHLQKNFLTIRTEFLLTQKSAFHKFIIKCPTKNKNQPGGKP